MYMLLFEKIFLSRKISLIVMSNCEIVMHLDVEGV